MPPAVDKAVASLNGLIAESETGGRRFLSRFRKDARAVPIALLREDVDFLMEPLLDGEEWGVVSDAGLPCVADPGSQLIAYAQKKGIEVHAFPGPSSVTMALMLSGLYGQSFSFHGYIAKDPQKREQELLAWEKREGFRSSSKLPIETSILLKPVSNS